MRKNERSFSLSLSPLGAMVPKKNTLGFQNERTKKKKKNKTQNYKNKSRRARVFFFVCPHPLRARVHARAR